MIKAEKLLIEDRVMSEGLMAGLLAGCLVAGLVIGALVTRTAIRYFGDKNKDDEDDDDDSESDSSEKEMIENVKSKKKSLSSIDEFTDLNGGNIKTFNSNITISKM